MIVSFYNYKVSQETLEWQRKVFAHFGIEHQQIKYGDMNGATGHGIAIDEYLQNEWKDNHITIFDVDCIPVYEEMEYFITNGLFYDSGEAIYAAAQKSSHIENSIIYASPAFISFSRETYEALGKPSFKPTERADCGAEVTYAAREKGIEVRLLYPTHVEQEEWQLDGSIKFGYGTTYGNKIYHCFGGHWNTAMFVKKCKEVIGVK